MKKKEKEKKEDTFFMVVRKTHANESAQFFDILASQALGNVFSKC